MSEYYNKQSIGNDNIIKPSINCLSEISSISAQTKQLSFSTIANYVFHDINCAIYILPNSNYGRKETEAKTLINALNFFVFQNKLSIDLKLLQKSDFGRDETTFIFLVNNPDQKQRSVTKLSPSITRTLFNPLTSGLHRPHLIAVRPLLGNSQFAEHLFSRYTSCTHFSVLENDDDHYSFSF
jgi:arginine repressor